MPARAEIEILASDQRLASGLSRATSRFNSWSSSIVRNTGKKFEGLSARMKPGDVLKASGLAKAASFGVDMAFEGARSTREFEKELVYFGMSAKRTPEQLDELRKRFHAVSVATGISSVELAKASRVYFDLTSDGDGAATALDKFARIAVAADASLEDVVKTAAAMADSMGIGPEQFTSIFSGLIAQADVGKIGLKDMGVEFTKLLPKFAKFGGAQGRAGVVQLGAAFQVAAKGFGTAAEAATGLENLMGMLVARQAHLEAHGVKVFEKKNGQVVLRNMHDIITDISKKLKDPRAWGKIFGENKEGLAALDQIMQRKALYDEAVKAGENATEVDQRFAAVTTSNAGKIDIAFNKAKESMAAAFTPERIERFANAAGKAAEYFADFVELFSDAVDVVKDVTDAIAVGDEEKAAAVRNAITGSGVTAENTRRILGQELGIKGLEDMTPAQRADALANAKGKTVFGIDNVKAAAKTTLPEDVAAARDRFKRRITGQAQGDEALAGALGGFGLDPTRVAAEIARTIAEDRTQGARIFAEEMARLIIPELRALKGGTTVQVDGNNVARAVGNATNARSGKS